MTTTIELRERLLPMLRYVAREYTDRTAPGYPEVVDDPAAGIVGIALDPSHSLMFTREADGWSVLVTRRNPRTDARSSASTMRHGGAPFNDTRPIADDVSDQALRNLIAELKSYFNQQPGLIHISDS